MNDDKLMRGSVALLAFAGILIVLGQLLAAFPIGQVTPAENLGAWLAVILGSVVFAGLSVYVLGALGREVAQRQRRPAAKSSPTQPVRQPSTRTYNYEDLKW